MQAEGWNRESGKDSGHAGLPYRAPVLRQATGLHLLRNPGAAEEWNHASRFLPVEARAPWTAPPAALGSPGAGTSERYPTGARGTARGKG